MPNQELLNYVQNQQSKGVDNKTIVKDLISQGWTKDQVDEAITSTVTHDSNLIPKPPSIPLQPSSQSPHFSTAEGNLSMWDAFEHILLFISLYVMASAIGLLLNFFVDQWFPPQTKSTYGYVLQTFNSTLVNGYISSLIVSTPIFSIMYFLIQKRTKENPEVKNLKARKVLIYFTLTITFIIMLVQVVSVVFNFLNGNISLNSLLHFIVTVAVSGIIFAYYILEVKSNK